MAERAARPTALPYENAGTSKKAVADMQKILHQFGASSFGTMEDFDNGEVIMQFKLRDRAVTIRASAKGYASSWLRRHPHNHRMRTTKQDYERRALQLGQVAVYGRSRGPT